MAGGGGSTGGIGAQSPASGGFGGNMGGGQMMSGMGGNAQNGYMSPGGFGGGYGNNSQLGQLGNMANAAGVPNDLSLMQGGPHVGGGFGSGFGGSMAGGEYLPTLMDGRARPNMGGGNPMAAPANGFGGIEQDQEFRNFRSQHDDLSRQMNEYMQKAPMYQQLQELQGKMQGVQSKYAPQQPQRSFNRAPQQQRGFNPQQQLGGLAALLGGLGRR
jgi:hypothetical protein